MWDWGKSVRRATLKVEWSSVKPTTWSKRTLLFIFVCARFVMLLLQVEFVLGLFLFCVWQAHHVMIYFVPLNLSWWSLCILSSFKPCNIYIFCFPHRMLTMFRAFLSAVTFPRVLKFLLKWPLSSIIFFLSLYYFVSVSPVGFCIHFRQCNISSIMKVQLIT